MALITNYKGYSFGTADFDAVFRKYVINPITNSGNAIGIEVIFDSIMTITVSNQLVKVFNIPSLEILTAFYVDCIINMNDPNKTFTITNPEYIIYYNFINKTWL